MENLGVTYATNIKIYHKERELCVVPRNIEIKLQILTRGADCHTPDGDRNDKKQQRKPLLFFSFAV